MSETLSVEVVREGDCTTIVAAGLVDLRNTAELTQALDEASVDARRVVVDMRRAVYVDQATVRELARAAIALRQRGGGLSVLITQNTYPDHAIRFVGLKQLMDVCVED